MWNIYAEKDVLLFKLSLFYWCQNGNSGLFPQTVKYNVTVSSSKLQQNEKKKSVEFQISNMMGSISLFISSYKFCFRTKLIGISL